MVGGYALEVAMRVELLDDLSTGIGRDLVEVAHHVCTYSTATRGNIPISLVIE
jgi:lipoyl-dependent peroxiredoxin